MSPSQEVVMRPPEVFVRELQARCRMCRSAYRWMIVLASDPGDND